MAWSSFAHLPTSEDEYWYILSHLKNGMSTKEVDNVIAAYKRKEKVQHHYRSNLAKIGLFNIEKQHILLNYNETALLEKKYYLKRILRHSLLNNLTFEIDEVIKIIKITQSYELENIIDILADKNPLIDRSNFIRWLRPVVFLLKYIDVLSTTETKKEIDIRYLQTAFLNVAGKFGVSVPLELVENQLKKTDIRLDIISALDNVLEDFEMRFNIELLMLPSWATKNKSYKLGQDLYTHIKIKNDLLD